MVDKFFGRRVRLWTFTRHRANRWWLPRWVRRAGGKVTWSGTGAGLDPYLEIDTAEGRLRLPTGMTLARCGEMIWVARPPGRSEG